MKKVNPPLKWAGGKRWLVPYIQPTWLLHQDMRLVEPFCGGCSIALGLMPNKALLNDINPNLINFYSWLKQGLEITIPLEDSSTTYYKYREEFNILITDHQINSKKAAELFFYLNKTCFNGLCRFNKEGKFNVPIGKQKSINYKIDLLQYKSILSNWIFSALPYNKMKIEDNDFIFADPPYDVNFRNYSADSFYWEDQVKLTEWLSNYTGPVILCNHATDRIIELYQDYGFNLNFLKERIYISGNGDRTPADVVIAYKKLKLNL